MPALRQACMLGLSCLAMTTASHAEMFGGVEFPQGVSSFADAVKSYDPVVAATGPTAPNSIPALSIGAPDYNGGTGEYVSLGDGGSITLQFVDNRLTGSGSNAFDLWIFEVGPDVEDTFVEISMDGINYTAVGKVFGATSGIDIDAFGFDQSDLFRFVRLTDDGSEGQQAGASVGADIDAVGAISSVVAPPPAIPEPETYALMLAGLAAVAVAARRRRR